MKKTSRTTSFNKRIWNALENAFTSHAGALLMGREDAAEGNYYGQECIVGDSYKDLDKVEEYLDYLAETDDSATARDYVRAYRTLSRIRGISGYSSEALEYFLSGKRGRGLHVQFRATVKATL
jgi:hypothetical protein